MWHIFSCSMIIALLQESWEDDDEEEKKDDKSGKVWLADD